MITRVLSQLGLILEGLLDPETEDSMRLDPVCRVLLAPGLEVAWDSCESTPRGDGQLWASLHPVTRVSSDGGCSQWIWSAEIGVVRCASTPGEDGSPPPASRVEQDALQQALDASQIFRFLSCREFDLGEIEMVTWNPLGPQGQCVGGAWSVRGVLHECC